MIDDDDGVTIGDYDVDVDDVNVYCLQYSIHDPLFRPFNWEYLFNHYLLDCIYQYSKSDKMMFIEHNIYQFNVYLGTISSTYDNVDTVH